ncbi:unnamed protein product [Lactuca saligna]|uniref:Ubiquitin-like protease family profile domain-containing protein n=1 Tax=Lactuca saligna TaxID=75948 RepID=A0AA35VVE3_LACSI|nr:unnamed protein product [Lactuca saligna]
MDQKTNDQTENEDKEGNGEEDSDNGASQPEVDYLLDSNEADKNKTEGKIRVKEKDAKRNENQNDEEEKDDHAKETNNHEETIQQTKNQNLLDKVVDNMVDNVLGIGVSSLNSQEDEIWNHPEMKTIFDNIDIGSPMSTGKTNTLAEKEKSEGIHEQGTKVEKTKGDDTGKENSEDRNEGGTEAKNTKDGCEEKQTEIEKGNAEDRGPSKHDLDQPREKKLADAFKSPFKCRITDTKPKLTHQESIVCEWLFNLQGNTSDVVVQTKYDQIAEKSSYGKSICKHKDFWRSFRHLTAYLTSTLSDERKYEKFKENFHDSTNGYKKILNIKDIDMVFFPVVKSAHIFVIVFNLKKPSIEILDNSAVEGDYEGKYGVIMKPLKNLFVRYFKEINHPRANAISKESIKPQ